MTRLRRNMNAHHFSMAWSASKQDFHIKTVTTPSQSHFNTTPCSWEGASLILFEAGNKTVKSIVHFLPSFFRASSQILPSVF